MDIFNLVAGAASIVSLVISIISLIKVTNVQKIVKSQQSIDNVKTNSSSIIQVGGDIIHNQNQEELK